MDSDFDSDEDHTPATLLAERHALTNILYNLPYDLVAYLERAAVYGELGYPDLAAGDAYKALLICDEVANEGFEYHEQALDALRERCPDLEVPRTLRGKESCDLGVKLQGMRIGEGQSDNGTKDCTDEEIRKLEEIARLATIRCFRTLSISLLLCGCLKSAYDFCSRGLAAAPADEDLQQAKEYIELIARRRLKVEAGEEMDMSMLPDQGLVRREVYPWNEHEPDRFSEETLGRLNEMLKVVAPKLEVRVTELPTLDGEGAGHGTNRQLGLFAKEDIEPGEEILNEISLLAANNVLKDSLCDACSSTLPSLSESRKVVGCPDCDDIMFCDQACLGRAQESYHPAVCDTDIDTIAKDPDPKEKPFALYLLLLGRALAMAATQNVHPLDLEEVKYIWGDFLPSASNAVPLSPNAGPPPTWTLPFSFSSNISGPLHFLEKMGIDVFSSLTTYDLWIFNTLYAKFRGTASARVNNRTGHPEVAAVHPLWCLANHDCDPNVRWEWGGRMRFWCREKRVDARTGGVKKGEEILNHYCDIDLTVKERREWAKGSLGGLCMCGRCRSEAIEEEGTATSNGVAH